MIEFVRHWDDATPRYYYQLLSPEETTISLFGWEMKKIAMSTSALGVEFQPIPSTIIINTFTPKIQTVLLWDLNADPCVFLREDNNCAIWDIRPLRCRIFPLRSLHLIVDPSGPGFLRSHAPSLEEGDDCDPYCCFCSDHAPDPIMADFIEKMSYIKLKEFEQYVHLLLQYWETQEIEKFRMLKNKSRQIIMEYAFTGTVDLLDYAIMVDLITPDGADRFVDLVATYDLK